MGLARAKRQGLGRADRAARRCTVDGFSLLELVLVIFIIATVAAIALPRMSNSLIRHRVGGVAWRIAADLEYARVLASSQSASRQIVFDVANDSYELIGATSMDHAGAAYIVDLSREPHGATLETADFGGDATVVFDGYGVPDTGGTVTVKVGDITKTVTLEAETGKVVVQ